MSQGQRTRTRKDQGAERDADLNEAQKEGIRNLTMLKMHLLGGMITEHGIETVVAHPVHIDRFLDTKSSSIFSAEETKKLPIYSLIQKYEWVTKDQKCVEIGHRISRSLVNKFAVCTGEPLVSVAALQFMPDYQVARLVFTLGHDADYRPQRGFDWNDLIEAVKKFLSYEEYKKVLAEGTRLFEEAVPQTFENLIVLASRKTFMLDTLKRCRPERESRAPQSREDGSDPGEDSPAAPEQEDPQEDGEEDDYPSASDLTMLVEFLTNIPEPDARVTQLIGKAVSGELDAEGIRSVGETLGIELPPPPAAPAAEETADDAKEATTV